MYVRISRSIPLFFYLLFSEFPLGTHAHLKFYFALRIGPYGVFPRLTGVAKWNFAGKCVPKYNSCHYPHLLAMNSSGKKRMFEFNIPTGFSNKARGCGTPLPWVGNYPQFPFTPTGLRYIGANTVLENRRNSVGVKKREEETSLTQGSGVPQPLGYDMESRWDSEYIRRHLNTPS